MPKGDYKIKMARAGFQRVMENVRFNSETGCVEWQGHKDQCGYGRLRVGSRVAGTRRMERAHRIVWREMRGEIPEGKHVLHKCDNPACVAIWRLFLGSHAENMEDRMRKGRSYRHIGEKNGSAKISEADVRRIRELAGTLSQQKIADMFGITQTAVSSIQRRKAWTCVA